MAKLKNVSISEKRYNELMTEASAWQKYCKATQDQCSAENAAPIRVKCLRVAADLTSGDRQQTYGEATANMTHFAGLLSAYFADRFDLDIHNTDSKNQFLAEDAAMVMVLAKLSRVAIGQARHEDNYIDGAAYIAIADECRVYQEERL